MWLVSNYNQDISWIKDYTDEYVIYNQGNPIEDPKSIQRPHIGADIYDKFSFIVDNYDSLPDILVMIKANLFKYISKKEFDIVKERKTFTPLLTQYHTTYMPICFYSEDGMYNELNNSWYVSAFPSNFLTYNEFAREVGLPTPEYLKFAPGSSYIVPRENILKRSRSFYQNMLDLLSYTSYSAEAQMCERSLYTIWL